MSGFVRIVGFAWFSVLVDNVVVVSAFWRIVWNVRVSRMAHELGWFQVFGLDSQGFSLFLSIVAS